MSSADSRRKPGHAQRVWRCTASVNAAIDSDEYDVVGGTPLLMRAEPFLFSPFFPVERPVFFC